LAFRGHYEHSLDAKKRLSIPAKFRAAFSGGVVLSMDADPCIAVWTADAHEETIESSLAELNRLSSRRKQLQRFFQANSFDLELDAAGRVTLPPPLVAHAGVEKEVVVLGVGDHLEVWDRERWQRVQQELASTIGEVTDGLGDPS
jgi:MraZ protein